MQPLGVLRGRMRSSRPQTIRTGIEMLLSNCSYAAVSACLIWLY
ncbi:hypothetical protein [Streptomyces sp. NPDC003730]